MTVTTANWLEVSLETVIKQRKGFIQISDLEYYKRCRVQLHAKGVVLRDFVSGAEIKTKAQQVCRTGDFLVAEIDAKVGGFGIVPPELEGALVSSHYFLFEIDETALDRQFLDFYIRTPAFIDQVKAQGSTNYSAIRPKDVLGYKIPLPPLPEQRRIVARIEELAAKVEEARGLRQAAIEEVSNLVSLNSKAFFSQENCDIPFTQLENMTINITKGESPEWQGFSYQDFGPIFVTGFQPTFGANDLK